MAAVSRREFLHQSAWASALGLGLHHAGDAMAAQGKPPQAEPTRPVRVRVWCEGTAPRSVYPNEIDGALADHLTRSPGLNVQRARLTDAACGLADAALDATDVLIWWGHLRHDDVPNERAEAVTKRVREGRLGLIALHSSCSSKPFRMLMGMSCEPGGWREDGRPEHIRVLAPDHPIAKGVASFTIPRSDMFAEPFNVPEPETVVLVSSWDQGESVRSGLTWTIDRGRVVYLRTGHQAFPVLFHPSVRLLIANACQWAARRT
jgi:trehalose utilization protein